MILGIKKADISFLAKENGNRKKLCLAKEIQ